MIDESLVDICVMPTFIVYFFYDLRWNDVRSFGHSQMILLQLQLPVADTFYHHQSWLPVVISILTSIATARHYMLSLPIVFAIKLLSNCIKYSPLMTPDHAPRSFHISPIHHHHLLQLHVLIHILIHILIPSFHRSQRSPAEWIHGHEEATRHIVQRNRRPNSLVNFIAEQTMCVGNDATRNTRPRCVSSINSHPIIPHRCWPAERSFNYESPTWTFY